MGNALGVIVAFVGCIIAALLGMILVQQGTQHETPRISTPYQAVLLDNGLAYFGKLEHLDTDHPVLREVYSMHSQVNPETKQVTGTLVRRLREPHAPDMMILNRRHIVLVEPVRPESQLGKLIEDSRRQESPPPPQPATPPVEQR